MPASLKLANYDRENSYTYNFFHFSKDFLISSLMEYSNIDDIYRSLNKKCVNKCEETVWIKAEIV